MKADAKQEQGHRAAVTQVSGESAPRRLRECVLDFVLIDFASLG